MNAHNYSLWYYLTDVHTGDTQAGSWEPTAHAPFLFANGLTTPPPLNRNLSEHNYIGEAVAVTGLTFMSIALLAGVLSSLFVFLRRQDRAVVQPQPPFLQMLIFGTILMSLSILAMSFDESFGFSDSMLDACCMSTPWLVSLGYQGIYLALFSKLWRLNRVMQFQRIKLEVHHVVGPFVANMLATIAILVVWTIVDPWQWDRKVIDDVTLETYGKCQSKNALRFLIPLLCLMALSTIACGVMAFKCRDIDVRFSDSNYIFYTIFVQIQVLLVGIPVLGILNNASADATLLGRSLLIFVIAMTTLTFMILPKVVDVFRDNFLGDPSIRRSAMTGSVNVHRQGVVSETSSGQPFSHTHTSRKHSVSFVGSGGRPAKIAGSEGWQANSLEETDKTLDQSQKQTNHSSSDRHQCGSCELRYQSSETDEFH